VHCVPIDISYYTAIFAIYLMLFSLVILKKNKLLISSNVFIDFMFIYCPYIDIFDVLEENFCFYKPESAIREHSKLLNNWNVCLYLRIAFSFGTFVFPVIIFTDCGE